MSAVLRKTSLAFVLALVVLTTGAWQGNPVVLAQSLETSLPETPFYPGLTWSNLGVSTENIRINIQGDSISLAGERYEALEQFPSGLPLGVLDYYSSEQLAKSGWVSYDAFDTSEGIHYVFYHESGVYFSVEFLKCPDTRSSTCIAVWKGEDIQPMVTTPGRTSAPEVAAVFGTFGKTAPVNGATDLNPSSTTLSWEAYSNADKYKYCVKAGSECEDKDPNWTSTFSRSVTLTDLAYNKTYHWQVKATTCINCVPKPWVTADNGKAWTFKTQTIAPITIFGNAGVAGATLSYTDGTPKSVVSDANGNYSIVVPTGWSGTVTPSKTSYTFSPTNRTYASVAADQTAQNYVATFITFTISGSAGIAGVTLTHTNGTPQFSTADGSGNYSITVPLDWSGTVTPHKIGYAFTPGSKTYGNVQSNQTGQNCTAQVCPSCADVDTTGVFRPSNGLLYLKNLNITGFADVAINYGLAGDYPVVGDWDGNGTATIGIYRNGSFYLRNSNTLGFADIVFTFGSPGDQPIAGDWNNDGVDTIGVYRNGTFFLRNSNSAGAAEMSFVLGNPGDVGIAGDWNGDGFDTTGVFRPSNGALYLKNMNATGFADIQINYGLPGDEPVTGDWNNDGIDTIGVYRNGMFLLRNSNTVGFADLVFALGNPGDMPIAGNWDGKP